MRPVATQEPCCCAIGQNYGCPAMTMADRLLLLLPSMLGLGPGGVRDRLRPSLSRSRPWGRNRRAEGGVKPQRFARKADEHDGHLGFEE
jgi:hypothetical protein